MCINICECTAHIDKCQCICVLYAEFSFLHFYFIFILTKPDRNL